MAKHRRRSRKMSAVARRHGIRGVCKSPACAKGKTWTHVSSGSSLKKQVPKACAIVQSSGPKKGKIRKGCRIRGHKAFCDVGVRLPSEASRKIGKRKVTVACK